MKIKGIYYAYTIIATFLWSASFIATKFAYESFTPIQLGAVRTALAAMLFGAIKMFLPSEKILLKDRLLLWIGGFFGITLYFFLENVGVYMTSTSNAALIVASFPAITAGLDFAIFRTRISRKQSIGILLALIGVFILTQSSTNTGESSLLGNLILLGAGVAWALYNFMTRPVIGKYSDVTLTYQQLFGGTIFWLPFVLYENISWHIPTSISLFSLLYLSIGCSLVAYFLYNKALRKVSVSTNVSLLNLIPVGGVLLSYFVLGEQISAVQLAGGSIVIIGVLLSV